MKNKTVWHRIPASMSGMLLLFMAVLALLLVNSPYAYLYDQFVHPFLFWINEGLMALFFLSIGLELKIGIEEGLTEGAFNPLPTNCSPKRRTVSFYRAAILPAIAALGGMLVPALIYSVINHDDPIAMRGWATPIATDIAFAVGVLSLFGRRVPAALKLLLLAIAIFDDLGAVIVIGLFYTSELIYFPLLLALAIVAVQLILRHYKVKSNWPFLVGGVLIWLCFLKAAIHPTLAGFITALLLPNPHAIDDPLKPWIAYVIMPLFAFANAGFSIAGMTGESFTAPVVIGIICGLFIGKQIGITVFTWLATRSGLAPWPAKTSFAMVYGMSLLCGIGFTMSLFLGTLAFDDSPLLQSQVRLGVMSGSLLSGIAGSLMLLFAFARNRRILVENK